MNIWIPEPIYRLFPFATMSLGVFFCSIAPGLLSVLLGGGLVGYGLWVMTERSGYVR